MICHHCGAALDPTKVVARALSAAGAVKLAVCASHLPALASEAGSFSERRAAAQENLRWLARVGAESDATEVLALAPLSPAPAPSVSASQTLPSPASPDHDSEVVVAMPPLPDDEPIFDLSADDLLHEPIVRLPEE